MENINHEEFRELCAKAYKVMMKCPLKKAYYENLDKIGDLSLLLEQEKNYCKKQEIKTELQQIKEINKRIYRAIDEFRKKN
jgi:hypothetical protein